MADLAGRLVTMATALMPPSRRDWGRAIAAELDHVSSAGDRARLALGAVGVALLPPPGLADYAGPAARAARVAVVAYIPFGAEICLASVLSRSGRDGAHGVLPVGAYTIVALMAGGALARPALARRGVMVVADIAAGLVLAALDMATLALAGGGIALGLVPYLCVAGAVFAPIGAALGREATIAWSHVRGPRAGARPPAKRQRPRLPAGRAWRTRRASRRGGQGPWQPGRASCRK
jgi:hypothetical protein